MKCPKCELDQLLVTYEEITTKQDLNTHILKERFSLAISGWCGFCLCYATHEELIGMIREGGIQ